MISCCTITQPGRLALLALCIGDFARQTHADRELLIVHDGDAGFDIDVQALAQAAHSPAPIRIHRTQAGQTLGALRNLATDEAHGDWICQWDDDDRYHPQRLALQFASLIAEQSDFCFLVDQLHWFAQTGELSWDDWDIEPYPMNFVQGTMLGRRSLMPRYPELRRSEDTELCLQILRARHRVSRLRGVGWCYVYVFHGHNTFELAHHAAITRLKNLPTARLLARQSLLRTRLSEYAPPLPTAFIASNSGLLDFSAAGS